MNREEKKIMRLTVGAHGLVHLYEGVLPPLIPLLMKEFSTDYFHLGLVVTVFSYAFGLGSLPAGILADRIGPRRLVTVFLFGAGLSAALIFPIDSLLLYAAAMGVVGAFCSLYHPASNTLISLGIRSPGHAFGIHGIAGSLGVATVPLLSAWIGSQAGWRAPHVLYGLAGMALGCYSLTLPRYSTRAREATSASSTDAPKRGHSVDMLALTLFFLSATALGLSYKGIMTFLPVYMGQNVIGGGGLDPVALGGTFATIALVSGAGGQYLAGRLVDRFRPEAIYLGSVAMGTVFVFAMAAAKGWLLVVFSVLYAFFYFSVQPTQNFLISRYLPAHRRGLGYGVLFLLTFGVGSTAAAVSGYLADRFGLESVFWAMGLCFLASALLVTALLLRSGKHRRGDIPAAA
ncbi:MAG: MFS transporter [Desulfobacterales bacterium]